MFPSGKLLDLTLRETGCVIQCPGHSGQKRAVAVTMSGTHTQVLIRKAAFRRVHLISDGTLHALFLVGSSGMTRLEERPVLGLQV